VNLTVRMVSQIISATLDSDEDVVEGDMEEIAEVIDVWTFSRDLKSRDPNWRLVASEPDNG
jgi:predicted lipid-binding transport protein (Tim44 family)